MWAAFYKRKVKLRFHANKSAGTRKTGGLLAGGRLKVEYQQHEHLDPLISLLHIQPKAREQIVQGDSRGFTLENPVTGARSELEFRRTERIMVYRTVIFG